uniref:HsdM family class I SAM-dependent methyltransferase n=1 Tax=Prevotella sp. TaxID=59823 RepID=UPI003FEE39CF
MTEDNNIQVAPVQDIMHYESDIWEVADLLLAAGIKQSDFPAYMMPFFALVMVEGRMINTVKRVENEYDITAEGDAEAFKTLYDAEECGYNNYIVMQGKTLRSICMNDNTFEQDFAEYLKAFDDVLKQLLGIEREKTDQKFLNMDGIVAELRKKGILLEVASAWAQIDLAPYDNSAITTLEEHIKRRWADISASTAGEQYTPEDIIELIARIVALKADKPKSGMLHVYDPTCGGANLLFGVSDRLQKEGYKYIKTYGSELNDALFALAAIESRFRSMSTIKCGNTLTMVPFADMENQFDVIVANPPYGTKWKGYEKEVKADKLGQFPAGLPSISDGQFLFMQHILWQLADDGIAVEVHNGSTLFSGDAGSGESNIRKYIFDHDWVEAIIQMPQQEFFNTGIYTYLWIMNKNKSVERRGKVALIDGSSLWQPLKKSKGDKRREMGDEHLCKIVEALARFEPSDICKIYDREHFYYNKQSLTLTEVSDAGHYVEETVCEDSKPFVIKQPVSLTVGDTRYDDLQELSSDGLKAIAKRVTEEKLNLSVSVETEKDGMYAFCPDQCTILHTREDGSVRDLGCGMFAFKASTGKKNSVHKISIAPYTTGDYEIIPHHMDETANKREIDAFMQKYVFKPYTLGGNTVGVEINFTKEFYVPEKMEKAEDILREIEELDSEIKRVVL